MSMQLLLEDESGIPIHLDERSREAWLLQYKRASGTGGMEALRQRLANSLATSLADCLDPDLKAPTDAQLRYASDIARELAIPLPPQALRFRGAMAEFIDQFVESFQQMRRNKSRAS